MCPALMSEESRAHPCAPPGVLSTRTTFGSSKGEGFQLEGNQYTKRTTCNLTPISGYRNRHPPSPRPNRTAGES